MKAAQANRPLGSKYNGLFGTWLRSNGFDGISNQVRYRLILCIDNLGEVSAWRDGLDPKKAARMDHPGAVWHAWRRANRPPRAAVVERITAAAEMAAKGRSIHGSQDALRRAHQAMLDCRSSDLLTLARAALESAVRNENDLLQLLPPAAAEARSKAPRRASAQPTAAA
jgi:hypothetical protein